MHNEKERPTEYFPDGTPIDDWFYDIGMPELEELGRPYVLTEYGIWDDGKVYTKEIQKVIDLAAEEGGGVLVVPPGTYLTGALYFKQGVNLYVSAGATLKGSDDISDYDLAETRIEGETCLYFTALINADGLNGFTMCGPGTIDGNGLKTWKRTGRTDCADSRLGGFSASGSAAGHSAKMMIRTVLESGAADDSQICLKCRTGFECGLGWSDSWYSMKPAMTSALLIGG